MCLKPAHTIFSLSQKKLTTAGTNKKPKTKEQYLLYAFLNSNKRELNKKLLNRNLTQQTKKSIDYWNHKWPEWCCFYSGAKIANCSLLPK